MKKLMNPNPAIKDGVGTAEISISSELAIVLPQLGKFFLFDHTLYAEHTHTLISEWINKHGHILSEIDAVIVPEAKGVPAAAHLAAMFRLPLYLAEKSKKPYHEYVEASLKSITGGEKKLYLRVDAINALQNKRVLVFDDVISTGSTVNSVAAVLKSYNIKVEAAALFSEGPEPNNKNHEYTLACIPLPNN